MGGRLVALHGFTQTHHHVHDLAFALAERSEFDTITVPDLPGHGLSTGDLTGFDEAAAALPAACGRGTYLGYSMGGRFALAAAVAHPSAVERLVLIGATAGLADADEAAERRRLDHERAADVEQRGVEAFLADWLALPMFAGLPSDRMRLAQRHRNTASGLAHSLRTAGTGSMTPLWHRLDRVAAPTLVLAGEHDTKFSDLGRRLATLIPGARFMAVPDAGHAAHVEQPETTIDTIVGWIERTSRLP